MPWQGIPYMCQSQTGAETAAAEYNRSCFWRRKTLWNRRSRQNLLFRLEQHRNGNDVPHGWAQNPSPLSDRPYVCVLQAPQIPSYAWAHLPPHRDQYRSNPLSHRVNRHYLLPHERRPVEFHIWNSLWPWHVRLFLYTIHVWLPDPESASAPGRLCR